MKKISIAFFIYHFTAISGFTQNMWSSPIPPSCKVYKEAGIASLIQNKTWQMSKMYVDSIPLNDTLAQKYQFVFAGDSLQTPSELALFVIFNQNGENAAGTEFRYSINQDASTISVFHGETGVLQRLFKVVCLTPGHLAFQFDDPSPDNPAIINKMEYRFLVDYSWEYAQMGQ